MAILVGVGIFIATWFIVYNLICYKKRKMIYTINQDRYYVLNNNYFKTQLIFGMINSIFLIMFSLYCYLIIGEMGLFTLGLIIIFWGLNFTLSLYSRRKGYLGIKEEN